MFYTKPQKNYIGKFLYYCALCFRFGYYVTSTALPSMTQKDIGSEHIAVPPTIEQKAIADFLDKQCNRIDGIISDLEKQIETLQKYKKSLILETVTKGLNKNAPMNRSFVFSLSFCMTLFLPLFFFSSAFFGGVQAKLKAYSLNASLRIEAETEAELEATLEQTTKRKNSYIIRLGNPTP